MSLHLSVRTTGLECSKLTAWLEGWLGVLLSLGLLIGLSACRDDAPSRVSESTPPIVTITAPANLSLVNTRTLTVSGTLDDATASVVVNGVSAIVTPGGSATFTATDVALKEGVTRITATATDPAGNAGTASISVRLDTTAPIVVIDFPQDGTLTAQPTIDVTGMINDITPGAVNGDDVTVQVNGVSAIVANGSFLAADLPLRPGPNILTATATDTAGNGGQDVGTRT